MINTVIKYVRKIKIRNTVTGKRSMITFNEVKPNTTNNRNKLEAAGISYTIESVKTS